MGRRLLPRGPQSLLAPYVFAPGEVVYDTNLKTLRLGDGITAGGSVFPSSSLFLRSLNSTGDATDRKAAIETAAAGGAVILGPGNYNLSGVTGAAGNATFGAGATISGSVLAGTIDLVALSASAFFFSRYMVKNGTAAEGSANENTIMVAGQTSQSTAKSYQKSIAYFPGYHSDPSVYTTLGTADNAAVVVSAKDFVGVTSQIAIDPSNTRARAFAFNANVYVQPGSDGAVAGQEIRIFNYGSGTPNFANFNSKHGLNVIISGTANATSAIYFESDGVARWEYGLFATRQAIGTDLLCYRENNVGSATVYTRITRDGQVRAKAGLGVGNSATTSSMGTLVRKVEIFDMNGASLGFLPVYSS